MHTKVFSLDESVLNGPMNTFSSLYFITIIRGTIEETTAAFDGFVYSLNGDEMVQVRVDMRRTSAVLALGI